MDSGYTSDSSQCTKNCQVDCISDIQPLFLSKASIETFFPTLKRGGRGSTKPAMLNTTYEDRCEEDAWPRFDQEGKLIGGTLRASFITDTVVHATRRMRNDKPYQPDFSFNCLTLIAWVRNPETGKRLKARVLLDDASTVTIMLRSTADRLGLGKNQPVSAEFSTTGGAQQRHEDEREVRFTLESIEEVLDEESNTIRSAYVSETIQACTLPKVSSGYRPVLIDPAHFPHLADGVWTEKLPTPRKVAEKGEIDILLGAPYVFALQSKLPSLGPHPESPIGFHTHLGSAISAPDWGSEADLHTTILENPILRQMPSIHNISVGDQGVISPGDLERMFTLDSLGIEDCPSQNSNKMTAAEVEAVALVEAATSYDPVNKHYVTGLPWRGGQRILCTNEKVAKMMAIRFARRLEKDPEMADGWVQSYADAQSKGFCRPLTPEELKQTTGVHYLQTFCVRQPGKPGHPFRLVIGANQTMPKDGPDEGKSINMCLHTGPNLLKELAQLVIRVRQATYIFCSDISRMFLRFKMRPEDTNYLRFYALVKKPNGKVDFEPRVFDSLPFGLSSSPFIASYILKKHASKWENDADPIMAEAAAQISSSSYCDDIIITSECPDRLILLVKAMEKILAEASLPVGKYVSNSVEAMRAFPGKTLDSERVSVLGSIWKPAEDTLTFNLIAPPEPKSVGGAIDEEAIFGGRRSDPARACQTAESAPRGGSPTYTKRQILSVAARIFDILGLCGPFTLLPKALVQQCWKLKLDWDQPVTPEIADSFQRVVEELPQLEAVKLPRCFVPNSGYKITDIVTFCDASQMAYGATVYVVSTCRTTGEKHAQLAFCKAKVTPITKIGKKIDSKTWTICRLELLSAKCAVVAAHYVRDALVDVQDVRMSYFTDSQVNLYRLRGDPSRYYMWVHNRIKEILTRSTPDQWFWVRSELNPADYASRGMLLSELNESSLWQHGPPFLYQKGYDFNQHRIINIMLSHEQVQADQEERKKTISTFSQSTFHYQSCCTTVFNGEDRESLYTPEVRGEATLVSHSNTQAEGPPENPATWQLEAVALVRTVSRDFYLRKDEQSQRNCGLLYRYQSWDPLVRLVNRLIQMTDTIRQKVARIRWRKAQGIPEANHQEAHREQRRVGYQAYLAKFKPISVQEYARASLFLFRLAQYLGFPEEVRRMKGGEAFEPKKPPPANPRSGTPDKPRRRTHLLDKEALYWDAADCVIRLKGRMPKSDVIILPQHSRIVDLYLRFIHLQQLHLTGEALIAFAQRQVHVLGGRNVFKKAYRCCSCRSAVRLHQQMAKLPRERQEISMENWRFVSVDYMGPLYCYDNPRAVNPKKRWVLVLTCLTTRATHLEIVHDMTTRAFMDALRAHMSLNGNFAHCWSDNALYFREASDQLKGFLKSIDWAEVENRLTTLSPGSSWSFYCPKASSQAGVVEKIVGLTKICLEKSLGQKHQRRHRKFTTKEMRIILYEVANMLNNRPLSVIYDTSGEVSDQVEVTPNLLIRGQNSAMLPLNFRFKRHARPIDKLNNINLVYKQRQQLLTLFWQQFEASYVRLLKFTKKWQQAFEHDVPPGTFVLLREKDLKGTKMGKLTPALVVSVTRRSDNLISRLTVRAENHKEEITRDLRDFCMTEDQYLKLSQPLHRCLVHDLSEGSRLDKLEAEVALDHYSRELLESPKEGGN